MFDNDIMPYRKKSKKHPPKKADHKHIMEKVLFFCGDNQFILGYRCCVCGRQEVDIMGSMMVKEKDKPYYRSWKEHELQEHYHMLPIYPLNEEIKRKWQI